MAFGFSFGSNKTKTDQTKTVNKTETRSESGTSNTASQQASNTQRASQTSQTGQQTGQQAGSSATTSQNTGSQVQESIRRLFSDEILGGLEGTAARLLASTEAGAGRRESDISALGNFDPAQFVAGGMDRATSRVNSQMDEALGSLFSAIGGTSGTNSAAALLEQRLQTQAADELAGTESQLTGTAQQIMRDNIAAREGVAAGENQFLSQILANLRGGVESTSAQAQTQVDESQQTEQQQASATQSAQQSATNETTAVMQTMVESIIKALTGTTNVSGTENLKGTTKEKGSGFGLSL